MSKTAILAIDQGTTSSRAIIFSPQGDILAVKQREFTQHYPQKGWVEHDPEDIWNDTVWACQEALKDAGLNADDIAAIGIKPHFERRHKMSSAVRAHSWAIR